MIYCPNCGTANRDGSRFCNECGERLGTQTQVKCSTCGAMNPVQNVFCSKCGERIISLPTSTAGTESSPAIKGLSLPTKSSLGESEAEEDLGADIPGLDEGGPAWLRGLQASLTAQDRGSDVASSDNEAEVPDWLKDLRASLPEEPEMEPAESGDTEEVPAWLSALRPQSLEPKHGEPDSESEMEDTGGPRWLSELRPEDPKAGAEPEFEPEAEAEEAEVSDWLAGLAPAGGAFVPKDEWEAGEPGEEEEEEEIPDWLSELRLEEPEAEAEPEFEPEPDVEESEVPDWLAGLAPAAAAPAPKDEWEAGEPEEEEEEIPDWLSELRPGAPATEAELEFEPEPDVEDSEVPDWLAGLAPAAAAPAPKDEWEASEPEEEEQEIPDWLSALRPGVPETEAEPEFEPEPDVEDSDVPDWLAGLAPAAAAPAPKGEWEAGEPEEEKEEEGEEIPDWLSELRPEEPELEAEPEFEPGPEAEEAEVPDWLAGLAPAAAVLAPEEDVEAVESEMEGEELPDWLVEEQPDLGGVELEARPEIEVEPEEDVEEGAPDWLSDLAPAAVGAAAATAAALVSGEQESDAEAETLAMPEPGADQVPDWLLDLAPEATESPELADEVPGFEEIRGEEEIAAAEDMPGWLSDLRPEGAPDVPVVGGAKEEGEVPAWLAFSETEMEDDTLERATIPDWLLALKPPELREAEGGDADALAASARGLVEETGLLAGLQGTLPIEMLIAQPRVALPGGAEALVAETPNSRLFASVVARASAAAPKAIVQPSSRFIDRLPMLIVYLVLLGAVTLPLLAGGTIVPREIEPIPPVTDLYDRIELLDSGASVLVAVDYDPSASGEMDMVAGALIDHLMARGARIVAMSLLPAGAPTAQHVLDKVAAGHPGQIYGETYANLGYIPGQAAAVRLLGLSLPAALPGDFQGTALVDLPVLDGLNKIDDFDLVVELAATQDSVRWWIEQATMPYDVPLGAGTSASVEPLIRPYFETDAKQLVGIVGGLAGTAMYEGLRSDQAGLSEDITSRLNAQLAGHIVLIVTIVIGNVIYLARRGTGRNS